MLLYAAIPPPSERRASYTLNSALAGPGIKPWSSMHNLQQTGACTKVRYLNYYTSAAPNVSHEDLLSVESVLDTHEL